MEGGHLTPCEAAIVEALYRAKTWVAMDRLNRLTACASSHHDHAGDERGKGAITVHVCAIRKKLGEEAILSAWGRGYTLGAPGVLAWRRLTQQAA